MKTKKICLWILLLSLVICGYGQGTYLMDMNSAHIWHVAKTGDNSNGGHAQQEPIDLAADAKLTINATVTAAADGDTIVIWPGDYDENVDLDTANKSLTLIGTSRAKSKIVPTTGIGITAEDGCTFKNLSVEALGATTYAIYATGKAGIEIDNCDIYGSSDGLMLHNSERCFIQNSQVRGTFDGLSLTNVIGILVENCTLSTDGTYSSDAPARAVLVYGSAIFNHCSIIAHRSDTTSDNIGGVLPAGSNVNATFNSCVFDVDGGDNQSGEAYGVKTNNADNNVVLNNCSFKTISSSAGTGPYDLYNTAGTIVVTGCAYSTSSGTITEVTTLYRCNSRYRGRYR